MEKRITVLDFETSFIIDDRKNKDPSPYIADNFLVSYGVLYNGEMFYKCLKHSEKEADKGAASLLQDILDSTDLLIAYNLKFELSWLKACGFVYSGAVADPMIVEYVLARGQKLPLSLADCCERYIITKKKTDLVEEYMRKNVSFQDIPWDIVEEYGRQDVISTYELYLAQQDRLKDSQHLIPTIQLMEEFCIVLTDIESNGIKIDVEELDRLEIEYRASLSTLKNSLRGIAEDVLGATPVNLDSPEQLSQLIYSRKVKDKTIWKDLFNLGTEIRGSVVKPKRKTRYSTKDFVDLVKNHTSIIYKTTAEHCDICNGKGKIRKIKKDGSEFSKETTCKACSGMGYIYTNLPSVGGLRCIPGGYEDTAVGGFSTDKETLSRLALTATGTRKEFLDNVLEVNKIETYLNTFIEGIRRGLRNNNILHPSFMQTVTATGRLSSRNPNFQNQPRGNTFPVRKTVISRFENGLILEADARQLEFRIAGELSGSSTIFEDVLANIDVHSATSSHTGFNRQDSKPHTFAPVYGATPNGKPNNIAKYYRYFNERYKLPEWHSRMATEIINSGGYYRLPSGKEFYYGEIKRYNNGGFSNSTQIANYPVQYMATGELVPIVIILINTAFKEYKLKSKLILTVHDSIEADVYTGEQEMVEYCFKYGFDYLKEEYIRRFNYELKIPIEWEIKVGTNWLELKDI